MKKRSVKFDFLVEEIVNNIIMFVRISLTTKSTLYIYTSQKVCKPLYSFEN